MNTLATAKPTLGPEDFITPPEACAALLHLTRHLNYPMGLLCIAHASDSRDHSLMDSLLGIPKTYAGRMETLAFLGMTGHEVYVASGRAARDGYPE